MSNNEPPESLLEFPCDFTVKAMGLHSDDFDALVVGIVRQHVPDLSEGAVSSRFSSGGKYLSVSVNFIAESREQMDAIYQELSKNPRILMAL